MQEHNFLTTGWLDMANEEFAHLEMDPTQTCRIGITITDPPPTVVKNVTMDVDLAGGGMRFRPSPDTDPGDPRMRLPYNLAMSFLLGSSLHRTEAFESDRLRIVGNLILTVFVDRVLQQSKEIERVRARTASVPAEFSAPCWPSMDTIPVPSGKPDRGDLAAADALPATMRRLQEEVGTSTPGAQLYVSLGGTQVASVSLGEARPGVPYTVDSWPQWYCCAKPVTSVAIGQLWEAGKLDPFRPVRDYLPRFDGPGRELITIAHLMTHTSPVPAGKDPLSGAMYAPYETRLKLVYDVRVRARKRVRKQANYGAWWAWLLLAEIIEAVDGRSYNDYLREEILGPARITRSRTAMSAEEYRVWGDRQPVIYIAGGGRPAAPTYWASSRAALTECVPGFMQGSMSDLGRFLEVLLARGVTPDGPIISPQTLAALTARHRTKVRDPWGGADWGLGFRLECRHIDPELTSFSRYASPRSYGHDGMLTCHSFADPDAGLAVALHVNGMIEPQRHRARMIGISDAIYADLGLDK